MKTLVLGATPNPARYAYQAVRSLLRHGHEVVPVGRKQGQVEGLTILNTAPELDDIHTITLYLNPDNQKSYYDYILRIKPKRIIFNPGTENPELRNLAMEHGIATEEACTLVMLSIGNYEM
jgi:predicted CoA-binding protein